MFAFAHRLGIAGQMVILSKVTGRKDSRQDTDAISGATKILLPVCDSFPSFTCAHKLGMWLAGEKLHGTFYEHPTQRSFYADCHYNLNLDYLHESLRGLVDWSELGIAISLTARIYSKEIVYLYCDFYSMLLPVFMGTVTLFAFS